MHFDDLAGRSFQQEQSIAMVTSELIAISVFVALIINK